MTFNQAKKRAARLFREEYNVAKVYNPDYTCMEGWHGRYCLLIAGGKNIRKSIEMKF